VFKLLSLPAEAREELLNLLGEGSAEIGPGAGELLMERLSGASGSNLEHRAN
jgi:hypothetical protein